MMKSDLTDSQNQSINLVPRVNNQLISPFVDNRESDPQNSKVDISEPKVEHPKKLMKTQLTNDSYKKVIVTTQMNNDISPYLKRSKELLKETSNASMMSGSKIQLSERGMQQLENCFLGSNSHNVSNDLVEKKQTLEKKTT